MSIDNAKNAITIDLGITRLFTLCLCAILHAPSMSTIFIVGFVGVSTQSN